MENNKEEQRWCNRNNIFAYVVPVRGSKGLMNPEVEVKISVNGKVYGLEGTFKQTPYGQKQAAEAIDTLYKRAYEKYSKQ